MIKNVSTFKDLNKVSIKIKIGRKKYNAILLANENSLILSINMTDDLVTWRNCSKCYDILTGNLCFSNDEITLINCMYIGKSATGGNPVLFATVDYQIDRLLLGKKITRQSSKKIEKYIVYYENINYFTNDKPYKVCFENQFTFKSTPTKYKLDIKNCHIIINFSSQINQSYDTLLLSRKTLVSFTHNKKINLLKTLDNIYIFRNFLMILLKKYISVKEQYVFFESERFKLLDCNDNTVNKLEKDTEKNFFNYYNIKIENIPNLSEIYQRFYKNYNKLYALLEQYYNLTKYDVPDLIRVVNSITMLEYYSRAFDNKSALKLTKLKKQTPKKSTIKDAEFKDRVISLINKVNSKFNLSPSEINQISENIKNIRVYYIHYKDKSTVKKLSYTEQLKYAYFIQDIILLNIYNLLKLDITSSSLNPFLGYFYNIHDLL